MRSSMSGSAIQGNAKSNKSGLQGTSRTLGGKHAISERSSNFIPALASAFSGSSSFCTFALATSAVHKAARPRHRHLPTRDGMSCCTRLKMSCKRPRGSARALLRSTSSMRLRSMSKSAADSSVLPRIEWHKARKKHLQFSTIVRYVDRTAEYSSVVSGSSSKLRMSSFRRSQKRIPSSGRTFRASVEAMSSTSGSFARCFQSRSRFLSTFMHKENSRVMA
mmetsp:Transcript_83077/g.144277  ORF Transcript_83077/g.144277 Transcript_83077/m.144277 type:complete len:221 (+) Transcript_83077:169-831(+)